MLFVLNVADIDDNRIFIYSSRQSLSQSVGCCPCLHPPYFCKNVLGELELTVCQLNRLLQVSGIVLPG